MEDESSDTIRSAALKNVTLSANTLSSTEEGQFSLAWTLEAEPWLLAPHFSLEEGRIYFKNKKITIGGVRLDNAKGLLRLTKTGTWAFMMPPSLLLAKETQKKDQAWVFDIGKLSGQNIGLVLENEKTQEESHFSFDLSLENLHFNRSNTTPSRLSLHFRNPPRVTNGSFMLSGDLSFLPFTANLKAHAKAFDLSVFSPILSHLSLLKIHQGNLSLEGEFLFSKHAEFLGKLSTSSLVLRQTDHPAFDVLRLDTAKVEGVRLAFPDEASPVFSAKTLFLSDFLIRITKEKNAWNFQKLFANPVSFLKRTHAENPSKISIDATTFEKGSVKIIDLDVSPSFSGNFRALSGKVLNLSSHQNSPASFELQANYDQVAPFVASGHLSPFGQKQFLSAKVSLSNVELTPFSTYAKAYANVPIERGKLTLKADVNMKDRKLDIQNQIFLDQLQIGDEIKSHAAKDTPPLKLAVSLLQNRSGEIEISLPILGSLEDPKFDLGSVTAKAVGGLIGKALSSPFSLLSGLFDSEDELSFAHFEAGRSLLLKTQELHLKEVAKALIDRPNLKLDIAPQIDPKRETEALKLARLDRRMRAQKREEMPNRGEKDGERIALSQISISPSEYPRFLRKVYEQATFEKQRGLLGFFKNLPESEMRTMIFQNEIVNEEDLENLGERRARAVRDFLIAQSVGSERLFILPTHFSDNTEKEGQLKFLMR